MGACALLDDGDVGDPAIAEARHRADHVLRLAVVVDRAARAQHGLAELRIGDIDALPDRGDELVLADRAVAVLDQVGKTIERARRDRDRQRDRA